MTKSMTAIVVAAVVAGAVAVLLYNFYVGLPGGVPAPKACGMRDCPIGVNVYVDCSDPNNILASPEKAPIARGNADPRLEWTIYKSGYEFAQSNGIDFHGDTQFYKGGPAGAQKFQWWDRNTDSSYHKYTINLTHDGVPCPPLDPGIINGQ